MHLHDIWAVEVRQKLLFSALQASGVMRHGVFWSRVIRGLSVSWEAGLVRLFFLQRWIQQDLCGLEADSCGGSLLISGLQLRPCAAMARSYHLSSMIAQLPDMVLSSQESPIRTQPRSCPLDLPIDL